MPETTIHISQIPFAKGGVDVDREGYVAFDEAGVELIAETLKARNCKFEQRVLIGEEFGEHSRNTRYFGVRRALAAIGEI